MSASAHINSTWTWNTPTFTFEKYTLLMSAKILHTFDEHPTSAETISNGHSKKLDAGCNSSKIKSQVLDLKSVLKPKCNPDLVFMIVKYQTITSVRTDSLDLSGTLIPSDPNFS